MSYQASVGNLVSVLNAAGVGYLEQLFEEEVTLDTGGLTTDTVADLLPANAVIEAVMIRVTETITSIVSFSVGDAVTAARFLLASTGLTVGSVAVGLLHRAGGVGTDAAGATQSAAGKVRITASGLPGAGKVRITVLAKVFYA